MVTASKVPMLKPGEYDLWRMRMEQYIQMIDYSLWEVIENGNAPPITKFVEGVETTITPITAEEKAQRRNKPEIDTLSNDDLYNNLKIYELESDQEEEGPTNFALMAYSSISSNSEASTNSNCSSSCLENFKILKEQNEQLLKYLRTSKLNVIAYKIGLESVEARLLVYKKNEYVYEEDIKLTVTKFENSSKNISKLIDCQIVDKFKTSLEYNAVPPPYTGNFMPPKPDLSFFGLEEFTSEPIVIKPIVENNETKASDAKPKAVRKNNSAPIIED
ncbi:hypothetical protein Tco_0845221 [Tanacetum coccineum]